MLTAGRQSAVMHALCFPGTINVCGGLNGNDPHKLMFESLVSVGGTVWKGLEDVALLK